MQDKQIEQELYVEKCGVSGHSLDLNKFVDDRKPLVVWERPENER